MNIYMYDKVNKNKMEKRDTKLIIVIMMTVIVSFIAVGSFIWSCGFHYRFSHFLEKFAECTAYAREEDSLIVEMDGKLFKVTDDNRQGIFNYITFNDYGKEIKKLPEDEPIVLDYGNGAVIKFWSVPADKYANSSGLFIHYEDIDGNSYSYINYKMTLETIITRYLLYDNIELTEGENNTKELS